MTDQRSRYFIEVVGLEQLRQWTSEQGKLEKASLAVQRAMLQTAAASERYDTAAKQSALATARLTTEQTRAAEIAGRMATADQRLALETERVAQSAQRLALAQARAATGSSALETRIRAQREVMAALGNGLLNASAGIVAVGLASAKLAASVEKDFQTVRANTTMTAADFTLMRTAVLDLSAKSGQSFKDLADGFMHIANFGYKGADAVRLLTVANQAAVATGASTATTAQLLAKIMRENGIETSKAAQTMNVLWYAAANSDAKMAQLIETGGRAFAMASKLGLSFNETAASLSTFMGMGLKASDATTQLIGVLNKTTSPTVAVRKELAALSKATGVDLVNDFSIAGLRAKGLSGVFDDVRAAAQHMGVPVEVLAKDLFPNLRGTIGALIGTSDSGVQGLHSRLNDIADLQAGKTNPTLSAYEARLKTADQQLKILEQTIKTEFLPIGQQFIGLMKDAIPLVKSAAEAVAAVMKAFLSLPKPVQDGFLALGAFRLATLALGNPLTGLIGLINSLIITFRGVPAAAAAAEAGIAGVEAAAGGSAVAAGGARALIGRAAVPVGIALLAGGAAMAGGAWLHEQIYPEGQSFAQVDQAERDAHNRAAGALAGAASTTYAQHTSPEFLRQQATALRNSIQSQSASDAFASTMGGGAANPSRVNAMRAQLAALEAQIRKAEAAQRAAKGKASPQSAADKAAMDAYNRMIHPPKTKKGGRGADPEIAADRVRELNKMIAGEIYGQTHDENDLARHDAIEKAHDWVNQGANPTQVHTWLWNALHKIDVKEQSEDDHVQSLISGGKAYFGGMLDLYGGSGSLVPEAKKFYSDRANAQFGGLMGYGSSLLDLYQSAQGLGVMSFDNDLSGINTGYKQTMKRIPTMEWGPGATGQLRQTLQERSATQGYLDQLSALARTPLGKNNEKLQEELVNAQTKLDALNKSIQELTAKIKEGNDVAFGGLEARAQLSARQKQDEMVQNYANAAAALGGAFGVTGKGGTTVNLGQLLKGLGDVAQTAINPSGTAGSQRAQAAAAQAGKYANAAGAAVGVFQAGQQNGPIAGALGGFSQGAQAGALFGPGGALIGGAVGGVLGLFGGLFGGHHRPDTTNRDTNPALTFGPSGFDYQAYRFRTTGQLPTSAQLGLNLQNQNPPIQVVVSLDGVKQTIKTVLSGSTTTAAASLQNTFPNLARP